MKILVVGGAGYIGSHMLKRLQDTDYSVEVLDNLSDFDLLLIELSQQFTLIYLKNFW